MWVSKESRVSKRPSPQTHGTVDGKPVQLWFADLGRASGSVAGRSWYRVIVRDMSLICKVP